MSKKQNSSKAQEIVVTPEMVVAVLRVVHRSMKANSYFQSKQISFDEVESHIKKRGQAIASGALARQLVLAGKDPKAIIRHFARHLSDFVAAPDLGSARRLEAESLLNLIEPILTGSIKVTSSLADDANALSHAIDKAASSDAWTEQAAGVLVEGAWEIQNTPAEAPEITEHMAMKFVGHLSCINDYEYMLHELNHADAAPINKARTASKKAARRAA